jgi:UDP-glucose 4-epimerase
MRILVTGGSGYIGTHFAEEALSRNHLIISVDRRHSTFSNPNFIQVEGDICEDGLLESVGCDFPVDAVVHLAAEKSISSSSNNKSEFYRTNVLGTEKVLDFIELKNIENFIFASSAAIYGNTTEIGKIEEDFPPNPSNYYGETKLLNEMQIYDKFSQLKYGATIFRLFNIAGSSESYVPKTFDSNILPQLFKSLAEKLQFNLYGDNFPTADGSCVRDYVHVSDVARIFLSTLENPKILQNVELFNLATGVGTSNLELIELVEAVCQQDIAIQIQPAREEDSSYSVGSNHRLITEYDRYQFKGIQEIVDSAWRSHSKMLGI